MYINYDSFQVYLYTYKYIYIYINIYQYVFGGAAGNGNFHAHTIVYPNRSRFIYIRYICTSTMIVGLHSFMLDMYVYQLWLFSNVYIHVHIYKYMFGGATGNGIFNAHDVAHSDRSPCMSITNVCHQADIRRYRQKATMRWLRLVGSIKM